MARVAPILDAVAALSGTRESATALAHDIGYLLPTASDGALGELRNALIENGVKDDAVSAMLVIMAEMIDGFRTAMARVNDEKQARQVLGEGIHRDIAEQLLRAPQSTSELARELRKNNSEISRALKRMREFDIVDPASREVLDQRRAVHRLSLRGQRLAEASRDTLRKPGMRQFADATPPHVTFAEGTESVHFAEGTEYGQFAEGSLESSDTADGSDDLQFVEDLAPAPDPAAGTSQVVAKQPKRD